MMIEDQNIECAYDDLGCSIEQFLENLTTEDYQAVLSQLNYIGGLMDEVDIPEVEQE